MHGAFAKLLGKPRKVGTKPYWILPGQLANIMGFLHTVILLSVHTKTNQDTFPRHPKDLDQAATWSMNENLFKERHSQSDSENSLMHRAL